MASSIPPQERQESTMARRACQALYPSLKSLEDQVSENVQPSFKTTLQTLEDCSTNHSNEEALTQLMPDLLLLLNEAVEHQLVLANQIVAVFAGATRGEQREFWKTRFGPRKRVGEEIHTKYREAAAAATEGKGNGGNLRPDCVLEAVRRMLVASLSSPTPPELSTASHSQTSTSPTLSSNNKNSSSSSTTARPNRRECLRLINNCVAYDNVNRSLILHRGTLSVLVTLLEQREELDFLIPTLHSLCTGFDEPALDATGQPLRLTEMSAPSTDSPEGETVVAAQASAKGSDGPGRQTEDVQITLAEQMLAQVRSPRGSGIVELLCQLTNDYLEGIEGLLAELIELATRIGVYGVEYLVSQENAASFQTSSIETSGTSTSSITPKSITITTTSSSSSSHPRHQELQVKFETPQEHIILLLQTLLTNGPKIIASDGSTLPSIATAVMNILGTVEARQCLVKHEQPYLIWLLWLPYLNFSSSATSGTVTAAGNEDDEDKDEVILDLAPYRSLYLKFAYEISGLPEYATTLTPQSIHVRMMIETLNSYPNIRVPAFFADWECTQIETSPRTSVCVLLANTITTVDRAVSILRKESDKANAYTPYQALPMTLASILQSSTDSELVFVVLNLATRLAIAPSNQSPLVEVGILDLVQKFFDTEVVSKMSAGIKFNKTLEIQREATALIRLLIRGSTPHTITFVRSQGLDRVVALFQNTIDSNAKVEIARLMIEILRNMLSASRDQLRPTDSMAQVEVVASSQNHSGLDDLDSETKSNPEIGQIVDWIAVSIPDLADPLAFLVREFATQNPVLSAEGWFGLAMLSVWQTGRGPVLVLLNKDNGFLEVMSETIAREQKGPVRGNIQLLLANLLEVINGIFPVLEPEKSEQIRALARVVGIA